MVIVTRGHKDDMRVLGWAVGTSPRYIGMIGSKRKVLSVYHALKKTASRRNNSQACMLRWGSTSAR